MKNPRVALIVACTTALLVSLLIPAAALTAAAGGFANAVVIGWDGAGRSAVQRLMAAGRLPNLAGIVARGRLVPLDVVTGATDTKAGWTQLLTGYVPEKSGVFNNGRYEPIPAGYTVFERLEAEIGAENVFTGVVAGKRFNVDNDPPFRGSLAQWQAHFEAQLKPRRKIYASGRIGAAQAAWREGGRIRDVGGRRVVEIPGKPWYLASRRMDLWVNDLGENRRVVERALAELDRQAGGRFFLFVHLAQPDLSGHRHGEGSPQYVAGIEEDDWATGQIVERLEARGLMGKTLVAVTADHGFDRGRRRHRYAPFVFLAANAPGLSRGHGTREDVAPTLLKLLGVPLSGIFPALDGYPLDGPAPERRAGPSMSEDFRHRYNYVDNRRHNAVKPIRFDF